MPPAAGAPPPDRRAPGRWARSLGVLALAVGAALFAATQVRISGAWYGVYLLSRGSGRPLELKDDLKLGDGPRVLASLSFSTWRDAASAPPPTRGLVLEWDEVEGGGLVRNHLGDGTELVTLFGRYVDDQGAGPRGVFVGGAIPDVAVAASQNQSGIAMRDASGWHHIWCNVNEALVDLSTRTAIFPGQWTFLGSRVLIDAPDRVVLKSEHEVPYQRSVLRVERFAYFGAGRPFFRLGITVTNVGEVPVSVAYAYGDEPWVGEFGSAAGNAGWLPGVVVRQVGLFDPARLGWAGIVDEDSGLANFIAWTRSDPPDNGYFGNHAGTPRGEELGQPLASNEVFVGLEWRDRVLESGESLDVRLVLGMAPLGPDGVPVLPAGAITGR